MTDLALLWIEAAARGALLVLVAAAASRWVRAASARHALWTAVAAGLLLLPALSSLLPPLPLALPFDPVPAAERPAPDAPGALPSGTPARAGAADAVDERTAGPAARLPAGAGWIALLLAGSAFRLAPLAVSARRRRRLARDARPAGAGWTALADRCRAAHGLRGRPRVLLGDVTVPIVWGLVRPVVLLPREAEGWPEARRRHVLLHELAHVARGDLWARALAEAALAVHWFDPLAHWAVRRQVAESERAADDRVLAAGARPTAYADDLVEIARSARRPPAGALAMARGSSLGGRVEAILQDGRPRAVAPLAGAVLLVTVLAVSAALAAVDPALGPGRLGAPLDAAADSLPAAAPSGLAPPYGERCGGASGRTEEVAGEDDRNDVRVVTGRCVLDVRISGRIAFLPGDRGVAAMAPGAVVDLREKVGAERRRVRLEGAEDGRIEASAWRDGRPVPFGELAGWLADTLPEPFRASGLRVEERLAALVEAGGLGLAFDEVDRIESHYIGRLHLEALLSGHDLGPLELDRWLERAVRVRGDHDRTELLLFALERRPDDPAVRRAVEEVLPRTRGEHERRRLQRALEAGR